MHLTEKQENRFIQERLDASTLQLSHLQESLNSPKAGGVPRLQKHRIDLPVIVAITPTYARPTQKADLTRLSLTLRQVPNFHWILVEDSATKTAKVTRFLSK